MKKNERIRRAMLKADINQGELAEILGIPSSTISSALRYELAKTEQDMIIDKIRTWAEGED